MDALPALTTIANDAVRRQFAPAAPAVPRPTRTRTFRARSTLAALLERAAHALDPVRARPAQ